MMFQRLEFQIVEATGNQPVSCVMQCVCSHLSVLPFDWLVHGNPESPEGSVMIPTWHCIGYSWIFNYSPNKSCICTSPVSHISAHRPDTAKDPYLKAVCKPHFRSRGLTMPHTHTHAAGYIGRNDFRLDIYAQLLSYTTFISKVSS